MILGGHVVGGDEYLSDLLGDGGYFPDGAGLQNLFVKGGTGDSLLFHLFSEKGVDFHEPVVVQDVAGEAEGEEGLDAAGAAGDDADGARGGDGGARGVSRRFLVAGVDALFHVDKRPTLFGQLPGGDQGLRVDEFHDLGGLVQGLFRIVGNAQFDEGVRESHDAEADLAIAQSHFLDLFQGIEVPVDNIVEEMDAQMHRLYTKKLDFVQVSTGEEDSLVFTAGENLYMNGRYDEAVNRLENYLHQFPQGGFVLKTYDYLSDCYTRQGDTDKAFQYYLKIIGFPDNAYTAGALLKAARIEYDRKDYAEAGTHYSRLADIAEDRGMLTEALDGSMRCSYYTNDFQGTVDFADRMLNTGAADDDQKIYARYLMAKSYQKLGETAKAIAAFEIVEQLDPGEFGAEAKYELCRDAFLQNHLDNSENMIYELSESYADYPYWVAKGFILLADIYMERGNTFQAEQTLQSIIDNYDGEDLKQEARQKLDEIKSNGE